MEEDLHFVDSGTVKQIDNSNIVSIADLSTKQQKALAVIKDRLQDVIKTDHDDLYMLKWLKARCFDIDKAERMYRDSLQFKEFMKADKLIETYKPPEVIMKYRPGAIFGTDKEGSPVIIDLFGHLDMKGIMHSTRRSDLEKNQLLHCEVSMQKCREQSEKSKKRIDTVTVIFDMEGTSTATLWAPGLQMYLHLVKILEDNYPEMMKRMFVINAPSYLNMFWVICKPLVSTDMRKKIFICKNDYKDVLLKYIDKDQLPVYLGGTIVGENGDERCTDQIMQGGPVPKEYYLSDSKYLDSMECETIQAGEKISIAKQVDTPGELLRWEFRTDDHDIAFGITYKADDNSDSQEIQSTKRMKSHHIMEDGSHRCEKTGIYTFIFSNSHSWFTSKILYHKIEVL